MSEQSVTRVAEVMKPEFDTVNGMCTVKEALARMQHVETKVLIVEPRDQFDEFGMVTLSDIARRVLARDRHPGRVNVYEIMTKPALTVPPDMDIRYCSRLFARFNLTRAPVVRDRRVVGIVSYTDMVIKGMAGRW